MNRIKQFSLALCLVLMSASASFAAITADYAALGTSIETEVSAGLAVFLPIGGVVLAIGLAWRIGKRFLRG